MLVLIAESKVPPHSTAAEKARIYRATLDELVSRELLFQEALARDVRADANKVEAAYDRERARYGSEDAWKQSLAKKGFTVESFRAEVRTHQTIQALLDQERASISEKDVTPKEIQALYDRSGPRLDTGERLVLRHILIRLPEGASPEQRKEARARAESIAARAQKGEDFATLARKESQDESTAASGGLLPEIIRGQMPKTIEEAAFSLKPGAVSGVVESPAGFHVLRLEERRPSRRLSLEEARLGLIRLLVEQKRDERVAELVKSLRSKARIEIHL
jgi:parvulin-like peptidyl-prolyl isomerase